MNDMETDTGNASFDISAQLSHGNGQGQSADDCDWKNEDVIYFDNTAYLIDGRDDAIDFMATDIENPPTLRDMLANGDMENRESFAQIMHDDHSAPMVRDVEVMIAGKDAKDIVTMKDLSSRGIQLEDATLQLKGNWRKIITEKDAASPYQTQSFINDDNGLMVETTLDNVNILAGQTEMAGILAETGSLL